jgi:hypothetical protein
MAGLGMVEMVPFVAVAVFVLLMVGWTNAPRSVADQTVVSGVSAEVADAALFHELAAVESLPVVESRDGTFLLHRRSRPAWTVVGAVLLFPVGLVFLLVTDDRRVQVSVTPHPDGCRLRVVGRARRGDIEQVSRAIRRVLPAIRDAYGVKDV